MNTRTKGARVESLAKKKLEKEGWLVFKKDHTRWSPGDFYGQFDMIATKGNTTRYIQIKSNKSDFYTARKSVAKWVKDTGVTSPCEVWLYEGKSQWRCETI